MKRLTLARWQRLELLAALLLSIVIAALHIATLLSAGPLWRDEISSLTLATKPTWSEVWTTLVYDPFPAFFFTILREWCAVFGSADFTLRILGCLIGLLCLAGFWINARLTARATPLVALALAGLSPTFLIWGDSLRAYGVAVFWIVIAFALFWRVVNEPTTGTIAATTIAAIFSAQSIFTNAPLLFACGIAAATVTARRRQWRRTFIALGIGAVAALSLLPYAPVLQATHDWAELRRYPATFAAHLGILREALLHGGAIQFLSWQVAAAAAALIAIAAQFVPIFADRVRGIRDASLYALIAGATGVIATLIFFHALQWPPNVWYFLPMLAVAALAIDLVFDFSRFTVAGIILRLSLVTICVVASIGLVTERVQVRASNMDLIAAALEKTAAREDLIVICPFADAITFQRYFRGDTPWTTIPKVEDLTLHRWDQFMAQVRQPEALAPVLSQVHQTLRDGHTVWVATTYPLTVPNSPPHPVSPWHKGDGRWIGDFLGGWRDLLVYDLLTHAARATKVDLPTEQPISRYEHSHLVAFVGEKDSLGETPVP